MKCWMPRGAFPATGLGRETPVTRAHRVAAPSTPADNIHVDTAPRVLVPTARFSVVRLRPHWYVACESRALHRGPRAVTVLDTPLVLFRTAEGPHALLDRCAHRNVPLSRGTVDGDRLVCGYHGWAFDGSGVCQQVPALLGVQTGKARRVPRFAVREQQGFVWVYLPPEQEPDRAPFVFPYLDTPGYSTVRHHTEVEATLHATLENILDVPHTAFLHRGLFRAGPRHEVTAVVRRRAHGVEAEFIGEPRPGGVIGRVLAPTGGTVTHFDRFFLPSIAQVEYALGDRHRIVATSALTPVSDFVTRLHAVITFRSAIPSWLIKVVLTPLVRHVLGQDRRMLAEQTRAVRRFGGEQFVHTDVDLLGPHIWRLLRRAERGDPPEGETHEERVTLLT